MRELGFPVDPMVSEGYTASYMVPYLVSVDVICDGLLVSSRSHLQCTESVRTKYQRTSCITNEVSHEATNTLVSVFLALRFADE